MIPAKTRPNKRTMTAFWAWSFALHASALALLLLRESPPSPASAERVEVDFTPADELKPAARRRAERKAAPRPERQIVEQERRLNDEVDQDTRFLSAFNQKVLNQTRAERSGAFNNVVHGGQPDPPAADRARTSPREAPSLGDLLPKYEARRRDPASLGTPNEQPPGDPTRTDDYLKDVRPGLQTMISTREFVYYAYYNRIKAAVRAHWEPEVRDRVSIVVRQGRTLASAQDRVTRVVVTLDGGGELLGVDVISPSGVTDLDDAAITAFRQAAPFPNPPKGMLESDGTVKIRWDFVLEV